MKCRHKNR